MKDAYQPLDAIWGRSAAYPNAGENLPAQILRLVISGFVVALVFLTPNGGQAVSPEIEQVVRCLEEASVAGQKQGACGDLTKLTLDELVQASSFGSAAQKGAAIVIGWKLTFDPATMQSLVDRQEQIPDLAYVLLAVIGDSDKGIRTASAVGLSSLSKLASEETFEKEIVPLFGDALLNGPQNVKQGCSQVLTVMPWNRRLPMSLLESALRDPDSIVKGNAAAAIYSRARWTDSQPCGECSGMVGPLTDMLADANLETRRIAAMALAWVDPDAVAAVPVLVEAFGRALAPQKPGLFYEMDALRWMQVHGRNSIIPIVEGLLSSANPDMKRGAEQALKNLSQR